MKKILIVLKMESDLKFNEEEFIKNVLNLIPNNITVSMKEVIEEENVGF